jgi:hypothetical protein
MQIYKMFFVYAQELADGAYPISLVYMLRLNAQSKLHNSYSIPHPLVFWYTQTPDALPSPSISMHLGPI